MRGGGIVYYGCPHKVNIYSAKKSQAIIKEEINQSVKINKKSINQLTTVEQAARLQMTTESDSIPLVYKCLVSRQEDVHLV